VISGDEQRADLVADREVNAIDLLVLVDERFDDPFVDALALTLGLRHTQSPPGPFAMGTRPLRVCTRVPVTKPSPCVEIGGRSELCGTADRVMQTAFFFWSD